jgi:transcriptional regulator with XRE-family HTH domain
VGLLDSGELGARVRAARAYADDMSQPALADQIGMGERTLREIESGRRQLQGFEQQVLIQSVASATGLPAAFFTADFRELERAGQVNADVDTLREIADILTTAADRVRGHLEEGAGESSPSESGQRQALDRAAEAAEDLVEGRRPPGERRASG